MIHVTVVDRAVALVQCLNTQACLHSRRSRVRPQLWLSSFKETRFCFPLTCKDLELWGVCLTDLSLGARYSLNIVIERHCLKG